MGYDEFSQDNFEKLKVFYLNRITENGNCTDYDQQRVNLRKIREELGEKIDRQMAGLADFDWYSDEETRQRAYAKHSFHKQALDAVVADFVVGGKLPALDAVAFQAKRTLDIPQRYANIPIAILKYIIIGFVLPICGALAALGFVRFVGDPKTFSIISFFSYCANFVKLVYPGMLLLLVIVCYRAIRDSLAKR